MPPTFAGVSDGVVEEVTNYPQLIKLGYDVATKEEVRNGLWNSIKEITPSSIKTLASEAIKQKIDNYNFSDKPYLGYHELGKDGVSVVSAMVGTGFVKAGNKALENVTKTTGNKIKEVIKNKIDNIDDFMKTPDFQKLLNEAWSRYKGKLPKEKWTERYKTLYKNRNIGKLTEEQFQLLMGGAKPTKSITTSDGKRYFDNVLEGIAREVKSGPVTLSKYKDQILKDIEILNNDLTNGQIKKVEWHCFGGVNRQEIQIFIENNLNIELKNKDVFQIINY